MTEFSTAIQTLAKSGSIRKWEIATKFVELIETHRYSIIELHDTKPWGAYLRIDTSQEDAFLQEFFPGVTPADARLGVENAELGLKFLIVSPGERLSWQYHHRRGERWAFLTDGAFKRSETDEEGDLRQASAGDIVQFKSGERHRLIGLENSYVIIAEIWQHTDSVNLSDEDDIVRLSDDYNR